MKKLTVGSLFAGVGGLELGLEMTGGFKTVWQVENDSCAQKVLAKHWPNVGRWDDVRTFPPSPVEDWRCDLICGGFPCQDISPAGKCAGLSGDRSGLWYEMLRIVDTVRPAWVVIDNSWARWRRWVPAVRRDLWRVGYASVPFRLRASDFGLLHRRARAFVVANLNGIGREWRGSLQEAAEAAGRIFAEGDYAIPANPNGPRQLQPQGIDIQERRRTRYRTTQEGCIWTIEPCLGRGVHGIPARVDRLRCLGNAVVPQVAEWIGRRILEAEHHSEFINHHS